MIKYILILICIFSISLSEKDMYVPMEKESNYGDDVCAYRDNDGYYHVKSCEKGKYCETLTTSTSFLEICLDFPQITTLSNLKENKCSTTFECEDGLTCEGTSCRKCTATGNFFDYGYYGSYGCESNTNQGNGYCKQTTLDANNNENYKYSSPEEYKKCGKLTIEEYPGAAYAGIYYIKLNEYDYIGTVKDGEYVEDRELCESGYALYFYYGGKFKNPKPGSSNVMYLRCVTPLSINKINTGDSCSINYKINDGETLNYNVKQLFGTSYYTEMNNLCSKTYIKTMSERFREYSKSITEEERKTCGDLDNLNKYTCENNELIKSWFSYKYPTVYLHYNGRKNLEKVFGYLIQKKYPCYSISQFLNLKFLSLLLFILI